MEPGTKKRRVVLIATSNRGKLRDFSAAASLHGLDIAPVPDFHLIPTPREDAPTFEANACKKAEHYSRFAKGELVLADDSGLRVDALNGAPGVRSARYAADENGVDAATHTNSDDAANNDRLLRELSGVPPERRTARFVCAIAAARDGRTVAVFRGEVKGTILHEPKGTQGFGYDPLFYVEVFDKTFAELSAAEKTSISHRGQAFEKFLRWCENQQARS
ncbi:MAG TPA: RdgB/HAM1 family non-canonical purine NTP pyrophosphatase [Terriglobales bacterium]|nr:RdgB/HAM1 family non-canonical purine NTP pyrophosphatase [Terriglobales bacterium]